MKPGRRKPGPKALAASAARSTSRAVIALAVLGGLVLLYGWNSYFLAPRSKAKAAVQKDLAASRTQEQELRRSIAELKKLAGNTQAREAELARIGRLVPADPDVAGAILALNDTANQAQVAWSSFVPSPPTASLGGPTSVGIAMKVAGTFAQIYDYLRRLELLDRLVVVDGLALTGGGSTGGSPLLNADVKARMFAAGTATPAPATAVAAALPKAGG